ncbi:hypothetical protein C1646_672673 [Rhizophagus diaphanus]|nr:hypothetical protein C1646_672673 [Rhizophagus diaphanus] [Rhizophagus sp. MUCL 43196]
MEIYKNQIKYNDDGLVNRDGKVLGSGPKDLVPEPGLQIFKSRFWTRTDINQPADSPDRYYQLTISDEFWLKNARNYGKICIKIDGKYDLNLECVPVLSIVTKNSADCGLPVVFVCECQNNNLKPYILIDKYRPSKLAIQNALHKPILCWFHIMKTFSKNLNKWQILAKFRIKFQSETIVSHEDLNKFESGLVTLFNTQMIEQEQVVPASIKNNVIYQDDIENSYQEIIRLYNMQGNKIFYPLKRSSQKIKDPFQPAE